MTVHDEPNPEAEMVKAGMAATGITCFYTADGRNVATRPDSILHEHSGRLALIALLIHRLGGKVTFSQEDLNTVSYTIMKEEGFEDSSCMLTLKMGSPPGQMQ